MSEEKPKMQFIPFHAINEFMRSDFRVIVLRSTMQALPELPSKTQASLNKLTKKYVKVPGFRNSAKAPASVKAVSMVKPFEKEPKLVAEILSAWSEAHIELRQQIFEILTDFEWKLLPVEASRTRLPGFLMDWPEEEDYELIYQVYMEKHPESEYSIDEVSLMAVWLAMRLPVEKAAKADLSNLPFDLNQPPEEENE